MLGLIIASVGFCAFICMSVILIKKIRAQSLTQILRDVHFSVLYTLMGVKENMEDIVSRRKNKTELITRSGEVAIVTGGARGIGVEVVKQLLQCDMLVIIGCRNVKAGQKACDSIRKSGTITGDVKCYHLDVASMASIKTFAEVVLENHPQVNYLVNNAGIMFVPYSLTEDGFEQQFATNYLGHCYLSHLLLPSLAASGRSKGKHSRIVNVTSCIHYLGDINFKDLTMKNEYMDVRAYGQSKLAQVLFTKALDARLKAANILVQVHSVHPGITYTGLFDNSLLAKVMPLFIRRLTWKSAEEGARSVVHACISPKLAARGGTYITNCSLTETGGLSNSTEMREKLWKVMMNLLQLETFGGVLS